MPACQISRKCLPKCCTQPETCSRQASAEKNWKLRSKILSQQVLDPRKSVQAGVFLYVFSLMLMPTYCVPAIYGTSYVVLSSKEVQLQVRTLYACMCFFMLVSFFLCCFWNTYFFQDVPCHNTCVILSFHQYCLLYHAMSYHLRRFCLVLLLRAHIEKVMCRLGIVTSV